MHRLLLNILETKYMISSNIQHFETNKILSFGNFVAERVTNFMYLGMIIDEMVIWKDHTRALSIKISQGTGMLNRLKHFIPHEALKTLYYTIFSSHLEYGGALWPNSFNYNTCKIQVMQNRAVKTAFSYKYSTRDSFRQGKVLNVSTSTISRLQVAS